MLLENGMNITCSSNKTIRFAMCKYRNGEIMNFIKEKGPGIAACLAIALPSWYLGKLFPVIGGAVIAILSGMVITLIWKD